MHTRTTLEALARSGKVEESHAKAEELLAAPEASDRHEAALFIIFHNVYRHFPAALQMLRPLLPQLQNDLQSCAAVAFAAWYVNDQELCRWGALRCIAIAPQSLTGYHRLGLLEISRGNYADAYCALSAGKFHSTASNGIDPWHVLAKNLMQNVRTVKFDFDGMDFRFQLATHNGQFLEMACNHACGTLYEAGELRMAKDLFGTCATIVEVGALVGNHTVFFARALGPKQMFVFDANPLAIAEIETNLGLNGFKDGGPAINLHLAAVGAKAGHVKMFERDIEMICLDEKVTVPVDFLKIDVDGMEMEVLEGCRRVIAQSRPKIMIEVQNELKDHFLKFAQEYGYVIAGQIDRAGDTNFFLAPG